MAKIAIIGGGIAGCTTALELAKLGHEVTILEQEPDILLGTSARTPGRMGLGYHYFDPETAQTYMRHTIGFMREYPDCFLGEEDTPYLQDGRYFVVKDSLVPAQDLMASYSEISSTYEEMCQLDPSNKIFHTTHLHRVLRTDEFSSDVAMDKVAFAIETKEHLLDWKKFDSRLRREISSYPNITIKTNFEVEKVSAKDGVGFVLSSKVKEEAFDYVVNCAWQNIERLNEELGIGHAHAEKEDEDKKVTSRLKLLAEVELPPELHDKHSMFFCVGPHAMFSNLGGGIGRITYAPITNLGTTSESEMPELWQRWLSSGLEAAEVEQYGSEIVAGVSKYIPAMSGAKVRAVIPGIVKSKGGVDLHDPKSPFHKREYSGVEEQQVGWVDNSAMKLFYCLDNAKEVAEIIRKQESVTTVIKAMSPALAKEDIKKEKFFQFYLMRNFGTEVFLDGRDFKLFGELTAQAQKKAHCLQELKSRAEMPKTHRLICVLDSIEKGEETPSTLDASPGYLHIHAISSDKVQTIDEFKKTLASEASNHLLTQWGRPQDKETHARSVKVSAAEVGRFGQVGIGSAARGDERVGTYVGGGEGFLFGAKKSRVTKGGSYFGMQKDEGFWTFQTANFNGAISFSDCKERVVVGREELSEILKKMSGGQPFVAVFDVQFEEGSFVRSNGIFPEDDVPRKDESLFSATENGIKGGHVVDGSGNDGDIESLQTKLDKESATINDFRFVIKSEILLKPVKELLIVGRDGSLQKPRTAIEASESERLKGAHIRSKL